jgi:hypothetical protein
MDLQASIDRVEQELLWLGEHGLDTATWCRAADRLLDRVVGFDGSCWHTIDPATVLITSHLTLNLPSRFPLLAANEYLADDVNKFADLAAAPHKVGSSAMPPTVSPSTASAGRRCCDQAASTPSSGSPSSTATDSAGGR